MGCKWKEPGRTLVVKWKASGRHLAQLSMVLCALSCDLTLPMPCAASLSSPPNLPNSLARYGAPCPQHEGARGKLFVLDHPDNDGRPVVIMRPR